MLLKLVNEFVRVVVRLPDKKNAIFKDGDGLQIINDLQVLLQGVQR